MTLDLLWIPKFLRRRKNEKRKHYTLTNVPDSTVDRWKEWDAIKKERYGERYDIQLMDQAPRIGSGYRIVYVKEGRKWAYMTSHAGDPDKKEGKVVKRFSMKEWNNIKAGHEKYTKRNDPEAVKKRMKRRRYR